MPPGISTTEVKSPMHGSSAESSICYDEWKWHCQAGQVDCYYMLVYIFHIFTELNVHTQVLLFQIFANIQPLSVYLTYQHTMDDELWMTNYG